MFTVLKAKYQGAVLFDSSIALILARFCDKINNSMSKGVIFYAKIDMRMLRFFIGWQMAEDIWLSVSEEREMSMKYTNKNK